MKKLLFTLFSILTLSTMVIAQGDLDITEVYFSNAGSTSGRIQSDSVAINTQYFIICTFQNNLVNQQLQATDSISFGYSVDGTKIGETGKVVGTPISGGGQFPFIIDAFYNTGAATKNNVEMCVWSLYNPYNAQTTDNNLTELCRSSFTFFDPNAQQPGSVGEVGELKSVSAFYAREAVQVMFNEVTQGRNFKAQVIDLTGQVVLEEDIDISSGGNVYHSIAFGDQPQGVYLLNVYSDTYSKTVKFVKN